MESAAWQAPSAPPAAVAFCLRINIYTKKATRRDLLVMAQEVLIRLPQTLLLDQERVLLNLEVMTCNEHHHCF